ARLAATRRKLLMLHMIHLVAVEFGAAQRPAVFVPVVERAVKDPAFEVRRDAAAVLGSLAKAVSADLAVDVLFQCFLQLAQDSVWQVRQSAARHALPGLALVLATRETPRDALVDAFAYTNRPPRPVADRQWLQLVESLAGSREPSHHVRAAVFESVGRLALALADCPKSRDALTALVVGDVQRAHGGSGSGGGGGLFGGTSGGDDGDGLDDEDDDAGDDDGYAAGTAYDDADEAAAAAEASAVMIRALGSGTAALPRASRGRHVARTRLHAPQQTQHATRAVGRDVVYQCAFNFPALLAALGSPTGWERLRDVYMQLSKTEHFEARRTLASSLHEVARMLAGTSSTCSAAHSADLESVLCLFLIDSDEIKMAALEHLGDTLRWLTPAGRVRCLPMVTQVFRHDGRAWRTRQLMARQLVELCRLFPAALVVGSLLPLAVDWAHDAVAGVRAAVAPAFPIVFELTKLDPATQVRFFETVISFSHAQSFRGRLFFVEICAALLAHDQDPDADPVDFDQFFLPSLAALAADRVANVRIALARLVRRMLENRMRRQSISATLADIWAAGPLPDQLAAVSVASPSPSPKPADADARFHAHRSLESAARRPRRPRRNTTPMRAHLLATMVQQLAADSDRDVLDLVRDLPGLPIIGGPITAPAPVTVPVPAPASVSAPSSP
ncbi:hypothetical protein GGI05_005316, partial [Coemansia sp. RSA 2603]